MYVEKWNGVTPTTLAGNGMGMLMNLPNK